MNENVLKAIATHGPWAVLAVVLIGFQMWEVRPAIANLNTAHMQMEEQQQEESAEIKNVLGQVLMAIERSNYLERRNCINTAPTQEDRFACARDRD